MSARLPITLALMLCTLTSCGCFDSCNFCFDPWSSSNSNDVPGAPDVNLPSPVLSIHAEETTRIIQEMAAELKHARHLHLEQANTYYNEEGIHTVQLKFISQDILELCEARMLMVDLVSTLLDKYNSDPLLFPELSNGGLYPQNLEIYINFESYYIKYVDPFYVKWVCMEDGSISFYTADADDTDKNNWHVKRESFYTSRDIVFYERKGEEAYDKAHGKGKTIFGSKRYYPEDE